MLSREERDVIVAVHLVGLYEKMNQIDFGSMGIDNGFT